MAAYGITPICSGLRIANNENTTSASRNLYPEGINPIGIERA